MYAHIFSGPQCAFSCPFSFHVRLNCWVAITVKLQPQLIIIILLVTIIIIVTIIITIVLNPKPLNSNPINRKQGDLMKTPVHGRWSESVQALTGAFQRRVPSWRFRASVL